MAVKERRRPLRHRNFRFPGNEARFTEVTVLLIEPSSFGITAAREYCFPLFLSLSLSLSLSSSPFDNHSNLNALFLLQGSLQAAFFVRYRVERGGSEAQKASMNY